MGSLSKSSYAIKKANPEIAKPAKFPRKRATAISVKDYEEAGLVLSREDLVEVKEKKTVSASVGLKENHLQGSIVNKGGDTDTKQAPKMAAASEEGNGKKEWEMEMEMELEKKEWPGPWEFERDEHYYQWIWYCPDVVFAPDYDQLPNYI